MSRPPQGAKVWPLPHQSEPAHRKGATSYSNNIIKNVKPKKLQGGVYFRLHSNLLKD